MDEEYLEICVDSNLKSVFKEIYEDENLENKYIEILFDKREYLDKIRESFKGADVNHQFKIDCSRSKIKYNGRKVHVLDDFIAKLYKTYYYSQIKDILMVCTQASFGFPFEILHGCLDEYNLHIGECSENFPYKISFFDDGEFESAKKLRLFDENNTICDLDIKLCFNLFNQEQGIIKVAFNF